MEAEDASAALCGIDGNEHEPVTVGQLNRLAAEVKYYHYRPMRKALSDLQATMERHHELMLSHIESDKIFFAKLEGARWAIYVILAMIAPVIPILYYLVRALSVAKVI